MIDLDRLATLYPHVPVIDVGSTATWRRRYALLWIPELHEWLAFRDSAEAIRHLKEHSMHRLTFVLDNDTLHLVFLDVGLPVKELELYGAIDWLYREEAQNGPHYEPAVRTEGEGPDW